MPTKDRYTSSFDPNQLQPAGAPKTQALGVQSGDSGDQTTLTQTPMVGADGRNYIKQERSDGGVTYITKNPDGSTQQFLPGANGQWQEGKFEKGGLWADTLGDPYFRNFLLASTAAGVAAYAGGAGAATGGVGTGAMSAGELAAMDAAGGAMAGTGMGLAGAAPVAGAGAAASGGGWLSNLLGSGSSAAGGVDWTKLLGGAVQGIGNGILSNDRQQQLNNAIQEANASSIAAAQQSGGQVTDAANQAGMGLTNAAAIARDRVLQTSQQAAQMAQFTPYNISGGLTGATFDGTNVTKTLDPRVKAIQDQNLQLSQGFLGSVNAGTPEQLAQQAYTNYNKWAGPQNANEFAGLTNKLAGMGLIGMTANTTGVNGQPVSGNPQMMALMEAQERAKLKNYEQSVLFGQQVTNNQLGMGNQQLGQAMGIDQAGNQAIQLGQSLGNSKAQAGATAGGMLMSGAQQAGQYDYNSALQAGNWNYGAASQAGQWYNQAAQNAASNLAGRRLDEAKADGMRDQNIWNSIWGSVIGA